MMLRISLASVATVLLVLTLVSGLGVAAVVALLLHQPTEPDELPQMLDEALDNAAGQDYRGRRRRRHFAPPVAHRPQPVARHASHGRLACVLRHRAEPLPVVRIAVPVGTGLYASRSGSDDTTVAVDLRAGQTEVLADGEAR